MNIPYVNLKLQYKSERKELLKLFDKIMSSGLYVTSKDQVLKFENKIKKICKTKYCVGLNSGTDALTLAMHCLGIKKNDEVITTSNSFIASTATIIHLGAVPIFVDVKHDQNIDEDLIEKKITKKTKAIMPVHLTGRMCNMKKIMKIAKKYNLFVIEDCAQSIMSSFGNKPSGSYGDVGCFSAHPLKNLNAAGDSGYLVTNNNKLYKKICDLRNHGMTNRDVIHNFGYVSRMDNLQAGILNFRLKNLKKNISLRRKNVGLYQKFLNPEYYYFPKEKTDEFNTYHTFVIQVKNRDKLRKFLLKNNINTSIHYPLPIHKQPAFKKYLFKTDINHLNNTEIQSSKILTLPINQFLKEDQIKFISNKINYFYEK
tara:strand:- start:1050 stop:2159 length:1110 start_codon:yes stop_codon:yes gene_type:complete